MAGQHKYASWTDIKFEKTVAAELTWAAADMARRQAGADKMTRLLRERSLKERVPEAEVILVGTGLDAAPAPAKKPGDPAETAIRFKVLRVLKGKLADKEVTIRHPSGVGASADEFIGKDWVLLLPPEFVASKHQYADCNWIKAEAEVKAILGKDAK